MPLQRGTVNVRVPNIGVALEALGPWVAETQKDETLGPLQWWPVHVLWSGRTYEGFVIRHTNTRTGYLEIVLAVRLRDEGADDGDKIQIQRKDVG